VTKKMNLNIFKLLTRQQILLQKRNPRMRKRRNLLLQKNGTCQNLS